MKDIILSDTHFGIKQNSITWLESQLNFIYNEFIPAIKFHKQHDDVRVIHCGDVFDSRSSINPYIATKVREAFLAIEDICPTYVIAGNHDFYSPDEDEISSLDLTLQGMLDLTIVRNRIHTLYDINGEHCVALLVPWYEFDGEDLLDCIKENQPKFIFCHTDLTHLSDDYKAIFKGINVYSGHIHTPQREDNLITLGSAFPLTFADSNADRGFYILDEDTSELKFVKANNVIHFWRFHNEEIFNINESTLKKDYIELYVNKLNLLDEKYINRISQLSSALHNLVVVPTMDAIGKHEIVEFNDYDILQICKENIPNELKEKFEKLLQNS